MIKLISQKGFTLIEMIVVLTIISIISTLGIAAFSEYNHIQSLNSGTMEIMTMLSTARSRALSQVIPSQCNNQTFEGYQVAICDGLNNCEKDESDFELQVVCGGNIYYTGGKKLPQNISIDDDSKGKAFLFHALKGLVSIIQNTGSGSNTIIVNGYNADVKTITVDNLGNIKVTPKI